MSLPVRWLGRQPYGPVLEAMQRHCAARGPDTPDELWLLEHEPVYTLGLSGRRTHLRDTGCVPVLPSDRGGDVTYHGPGQLVAYLLLDLGRRGLGVRALVRQLEASVVHVLARQGIVAHGRIDAPGVYVGAAKLASLGLRVRRGCCYHGVALNVAMDLTPYAAIDPCGHVGLGMTDCAREGWSTSVEAAGAAWLPSLCAALNGAAACGQEGVAA